jgi:hypothetical protein
MNNDALVPGRLAVDHSRSDDSCGTSTTSRKNQNNLCLCFTFSAKCFRSRCHLVSTERIIGESRTEPFNLHFDPRRHGIPGLIHSMSDTLGNLTNLANLPCCTIPIQKGRPRPSTLMALAISVPPLRSQSRISWRHRIWDQDHVSNTSNASSPGNHRLSIPQDQKNLDAKGKRGMFAKSKGTLYTYGYAT